MQLKIQTQIAKPAFGFDTLERIRALIILCKLLVLMALNQRPVVCRVKEFAESFPAHALWNGWSEAIQKERFL